MAIIKPVTTNSDKKYLKVNWQTLEDGDEGAIAAVGQYPDKTLQISGTLSGAVPALEGSMDQAVWFGLTSDGTTAIAALGMFYVWENPNFVRPKNTGGDASTDVNYLLGMSSLV